MPKRMGLLGPGRSEIGSRLLKPGLITYRRIYCILRIAYTTRRSRLCAAIAPGLHRHSQATPEGHVMDGAIHAFLADVRGILAYVGPSEQGIGRLVERMRALVHDPDVLATHEAFTQTVATGEAAAELFADTGRRSELL